MLDPGVRPRGSRRFEGATLVELPRPSAPLRTKTNALRRYRAVAPHPVDLSTLGRVLELSVTGAHALMLGLEEPGALGVELYVATAQQRELASGVYHFVHEARALERRCAVEPERWQNHLPQDGFIIGLTSIVWRHAWRHGARGYRYAQLEAGLVIAAVATAAAAVGWHAELLPHWGDDDVARLLGIHRPVDFRGAEPEGPVAVLWVGPQRRQPEPQPLLQEHARLGWEGKATRLSTTWTPWPLVDEAQQATRKRKETATIVEGETAIWPPLELRPHSEPFTALLDPRARRGASGTLDRDAVWRLLDALLPREDIAPWRAWPWRPMVHPLVSIYDIDGIPSGVYRFARTAKGAKSSTSRTPKPRLNGAPAHLEVRAVEHPGSCPITAAVIDEPPQTVRGCAFSLMVPFDEVLQRGAWWYRAMHWEAGMVAYALELQAIQEGLRFAMAPSFFDDMLHDNIGIKGTQVQSLCQLFVGRTSRAERFIGRSMSARP